MGYQESWFYIEPQHKFKKLIQAYEKAEQSGYYEVCLLYTSDAADEL